MIEYCDTCGLRNKQNICRKFKIPVTPDNYCCWHVGELASCEVCGSQVLRPTLMEDKNGEFHLLCSDCASAFGLNCAGCVNATSTCAFEADNTMNKVVMQTVQQGNYVMQMQVPNPELVKKTCANGCKCYHNGECARRTNSGCVNAERKWEGKIYDELPATQS